MRSGFLLPPSNLQPHPPRSPLHDRSPNTSNLPSKRSNTLLSFDSLLLLSLGLGEFFLELHLGVGFFEEGFIGRTTISS